MSWQPGAAHEEVGGGLNPEASERAVTVLEARDIRSLGEVSMLNGTAAANVLGLGRTTSRTGEGTPGPTEWGRR